MIRRDIKKLQVSPNRPDPHDLLSIMEPGGGQMTQTHKRQSSSTPFTHRGEKKQRHRRGERQEERLNLPDDEDPDPIHLERGTDSQRRERGPRTVSGPAQRSLREKKRQGETRDRDRDTQLCLGTQTKGRDGGSKGLQFFSWDWDRPAGNRYKVITNKQLAEG